MELELPPTPRTRQESRSSVEVGIKLRQTRNSPEPSQGLREASYLQEGGLCQEPPKNPGGNSGSWGQAHVPWLYT